MRTEELVRAAGQEITADFLHVDQTVGRVLYGVDERIGAVGFGHLDDALGVVDGAAGVAGVAHGDQLSVRIDERLHVVHVERAVLHVHIHPVDLGFCCPAPASPRA